MYLLVIHFICTVQTLLLIHGNTFRQMRSRNKFADCTAAITTFIITLQEKEHRGQIHPSTDLVYSQPNF